MVWRAGKVTRVSSKAKFLNRRNRTVLIGAVPVIGMVALLGLPSIPGTNIDLTVPYAAEGKGPTFDTLGEVDGTPVVEIEGVKQDSDTAETSGHLNMTTVAVRTQMTLLQAMGRWLGSDDTLVPIEQIMPTGMSPDQLREQNAQAFASSESNATIAAMHYLDRPMEAMIVAVNDESPAKSKLKINDVVEAVDGEKITLPSQLAEAVRSHAPGDEVTLDVKRQDKDIKVKVTLGEMPEDMLAGAGDDATSDGPIAFLGVTSVAQPAGNVKVTYNLQDVGGPSAGLMFSLAVVDKLSPGDLTGGKFVAGTGTIEADGTVGPIGGITHKIAAAADAGAEVFLVPEDNCSEALTAKGGDVKLVSVSDLDGAVADLKALAKGDEVSLCR